MNFYARLLAVWGAALSASAAFGLVWLAAGGISQAVAASDMLQGAAGTLTGRASLGLAGVFLVFLTAFLAMKALGYGASKVLSFQTASGRMEVDISALEDCLNRTMLELNDVLEARSSIRHSSSIKKPVEMRLSVVLAERSDVPGKGAEISARVSDRFLQIIPIETKPKINLGIRIRSLKSDPVKAEPKPQPKETARPLPPVTPVPFEEVEDATDAEEIAGDSVAGAEAAEVEVGEDVEEFAESGVEAEVGPAELADEPDEPGVESDYEPGDELEDESAELEDELDDELEDVPDFTGERRYSADDDA